MKKLLAIVMVAVMVLSMSAVAFAEEDTAAPAYTVSATAQENEDGTVSVVVSAKGNIEAFDVGVAYEGTTPVVVDEKSAINKYVKTDVVGTIVANARELNGVTCVQMTGAVLGATEFDGVLGTFTFEKAGDFRLVLDVASNLTYVDPKGPESDPLVIAPYVPETEAPTPEPTPTPPVENQNPTPTPAGGPTTTTQGPTNTPTTNGSNNAARTADVTPVAAMVTLVLMAGAVLVVLKKRAAE